MVECTETCTRGQLFIRCRGEPEILSSCHCFTCQHRAGSVFSVAAFYSRANIIETGGRFTKFIRKGDSGRSVASYSAQSAEARYIGSVRCPPITSAYLSGHSPTPHFQRRTGQFGRRTNIIGSCCRTGLCRYCKILDDRSYFRRSA
jgi:hypothetical protein